MIKKKTAWCFLAAILTSMPALVQVSRDKPLCVEDTRATPPAPVRDAAKPRLVRVQNGEGADFDEDPVSPCPSTMGTAFVKFSLLVSACLWACSLAFLYADVRRYGRRKRRDKRLLRRRSRRADGPNAEQESKPWTS